MTSVNRALRWALDLALRPFEGFSPWVGLVALSLVSAVGALLVFKKVSNQNAIDHVKRKMQASLFEIRLFNDDLRAIFKAQAGFLGANLKYLALNLVPLLWLFVPFVLIFVHLEPRYRYQPAEEGSEFVVSTRLAESEGRDPNASKPAIRLEVPEGLKLTSPGIWSGANGTMAWRVRAQTAGDFTIQVETNGEGFEKQVHVGPRVEVASPKRPAKGLLGQLEHPAEKPLPANSSLAEIRVHQQERSWGELSLASFQVPIAWWFWWLVLMVAFGLALRGPMNVKI